MDLDLTEEQELLRDTVRNLCARHAGLDIVRELENDATGYPEKFWVALADSGLLGLTLPEEHGGSGMSWLDAAVVYGELGRALAPSPHFPSVVMAGGVLTRVGSPEQQRDLLPRIASGELIVVPAWLEPDGGFGPRGVQLTARRDGDGYVLNGAKRHVPFAAAAHQLLVLARAEDGLVLLLVDAHASGITQTQQLAIASDPQYRVDFRDVHATEVVGESGTGWEIWSEAMYDGIILLAAQAVGGAQAAFDLTLDYAKKREQFDKPLGAFQAIAHYLADRITELDGAQTLVWEAAWARDKGRDVRTLAPMAKLFAYQTFRAVTATGQQVFGGNGFTVEFDIQLYFRRAKALQLSWWDTRYLEELVAAGVLD